MEASNILALVGFVITAAGLVVAMFSFSRRVRSGEILAAEERGKMAQRMAEVEEDVTRLGAKVRSIEHEQSEVRQVLVKLETGQAYIIDTLNQLRDDQKTYERENRKG